jgi:trehalose 6-phosphate phosphatase
VNAEGELIGEPPQPLPLAVLDDLGAFARSREGLGFENKRFGAALHFRSRPDLEREATDTARKIAGDAGLALKPGSCVIEVVQPGASKSGAVHAFMQLPPFRDATPVFVGDDLTDEDGFRAVGDLGGFGILVGDREDTRARYRLDKPACVRDWLSL